MHFEWTCRKFRDSGAARGFRWIASMRRSLGAAAIGGGLLLTPGLSVGQSAPVLSAKVSKEFKKMGGASLADVIVRYRTTPTGSDTQKFVEKGAVVTGSFDRLKSVSYRVQVANLESLASDSNVLYVSPDRVVRAQGTVLTGKVTGAYIAPSQNLSGGGVGVAIVDSGVNPHPDLKAYDCRTNRVIYNESFVPGDPSARDGFGHGTHVAAIAAGNGSCSGTAAGLEKVTGVAPSASVINLRVLDDQGQGRDSHVLAAIERAIEIKANYNIRVINLSLGRPIRESYTQDPLTQAVEAATRAGILVVTAAGNYGRNDLQDLDGAGSVVSPGNDPLALTVGAMNMNGTVSRADDTLASYSGKGPSALDRIVKPDLVAPGGGVAAANAGGTILLRDTSRNAVADGYPWGKYFTLSGTSMAAPMAAGAAALLLQKSPGLTPAQVKARLMRSAFKSFPAATTVVLPGGGPPSVASYDPLSVGAGYLDILEALNDTSKSTAGAISPALTRAGAAILLTDAAIATGTQRTDWATSAGGLYGGVNFAGATLLGSADKAWGAFPSRGGRLLWGDAVLGGDSTLWGGTAPWGEPAGRFDVITQGDEGGQ